MTLNYDGDVIHSMLSVVVVGLRAPTTRPPAAAKPIPTRVPGLACTEAALAVDGAVPIGIEYR